MGKVHKRSKRSRSLENDNRRKAPGKGAPEAAQKNLQQNGEGLETELSHDDVPHTANRINSKVWCGVAVLLICMGIQLYSGLRNDSATMDEQNHIARGFAYVKTGSLKVNRMHPPLVDIINAIPLVLDGGVKMPFDSHGWLTGNLDEFATDLLWKTNDGPSMVGKARIPSMILAILLGLVVFLWANEMFGPISGLTALTLCAFCPNLIAHGHLATNDIGCACFTVLTAYTFWRFLQEPNWKRAVIAALSLGFALTSKFSALFLLASFPLMFAADWYFKESRLRDFKRLKQILLMSTVGLVIVVAAIWCVYGLKPWALSLNNSGASTPSYFTGIREVLQRIERGNPTFMLGQYSSDGWWYFFPFVFLVKTPIPTLILSIVGIVLMLKARSWSNLLFLTIPMMVYFAISLFGSLDIGYRHLLPMLPLLYIAAARAAPAALKLKSLSMLAVSALLTWLIVGTIIVSPHYLAYFNEFAGGPSNGFRVLVDSNLDWGQDLIGLRDYMDKAGISSVKLSYFGSALPESYGIKYEPLISFPRHMYASKHDLLEVKRPLDGVYAISATDLQDVMFPGHNFFEWFRYREPDAVIGHSIFVYKVGSSALANINKRTGG